MAKPGSARVLVVLALACRFLLPTLGYENRGTSPPVPVWVKVPFSSSQFNLRTEQGLRAFHEVLKAGLPSSSSSPIEQTGRTDLAPLQEQSLSSLKEWFHPPPEREKKVRRGWIELERATSRALARWPTPGRNAALRDVLEIAVALQNLTHRPVPAHADFIQAPLLVWKYYHTSVGTGTVPARNLPESASGVDLSTVDPPNSTFWTKPEKIEDQDLFAGFGRAAAPAFEDRLWTYAGPKKGSGTCPGFEVQGSGQKLKVKFAETCSEPFAARIFAALGYNVEETDHLPYLKVRYDRRLLREFNLRQEVSTAVSTFGVPSYTIRIQQRFDPFTFIVTAVLKDGSHISGATLKQCLFHDPNAKHPEDRTDNFNRGFESKLDYLITSPANVHSDWRRRRAVGTWDFDNLGHADRRELRGMALLAGWIGWFDCRGLNTRLEVLHPGDDTELRHAITDLGSCLGNSSGLTSRRCELPNEFRWSFTRPASVQGPGRMTVPFRIVGFRPIETPEAFRRTTVDDARWMGRWIGRLTESQLLQALVAAGFDAGTTRLYLEKLCARRDQMVRDLGLTNEVSLLCLNGSNQRLNYDPWIAGAVEVETSTGVRRAALGQSRVCDGVLVRQARRERTLRTAAP